MQGTSLVPLIEEPKRKWKTAAFSQFHRRPKVSADGQRYMGYSINTDKHHYIEWYSWDHKKGLRGELKNTELYHRINDPNEMVNIANDDSQVRIVEDLSNRLAAGWQAALIPSE